MGEGWTERRDPNKGLDLRSPSAQGRGKHPSGSSFPTASHPSPTWLGILSSQGPVLTRLASHTPTGWEGTHWVHYCMSQELPSPGSLDCAHFRSSSNQPELEVATPFTYLAHNQPPLHCTLCATPRSMVLTQGWLCHLAVSGAVSVSSQRRGAWLPST